MNDAIDRRTMLAFAGAGAATAGATSASADDTRSSSSQRGGGRGKEAVQIPKDNALFAASHAAFEKFGYSPAVRAGGLLFIAGLVGVRPDGTVPDSVGEQTEWALRRKEEILRLEGLTMADLVEVVSYHVDINQNLAAFLPVKERFMQRPFPAWSIIGIDALTRPALKIEIRSVAAYPA